MKVQGWSKFNIFTPLCSDFPLKIINNTVLSKTKQRMKKNFQYIKQFFIRFKISGSWRKNTESFLSLLCWPNTEHRILIWTIRKPDMYPDPDLLPETRLNSYFGIFVMEYFSNQIKFFLFFFNFFFINVDSSTECLKIYRKSVLHLLKLNLYISRCNTVLP